jgi:hypothetical protein
MEFPAMHKSPKGRSAASVSPMFEALENRQFLSASLVNGVLKVFGTAGADNITVGINSSDTSKIAVQEGSAVKSFVRAKVKTISILSSDGNDHIVINNGIKQQITLKLGEGDDSVHGGSGREIIFGGPGNDTVLAGGGSDFISGDAGNDNLSGGSGNDYVYGDEGNDSLKGDAGNDVLGGDWENKLVFSGEPPLMAFPGQDTLDGGDGNDWLLCERRFLGTEGLTRIFARNGADRLTGGAGNDVIDRGVQGIGDDDIITDEEPGDFVPSTEYPEHSERENSNDVHTHVTLKIRVRSGSKLKKAIVQPNLGFFAPNNFAGLHTHDTSGVIHYEAPPNAPSYRMDLFFKVVGISMDANHIGRFIPPAGKKMTMWITRRGETFQSKAFGKFVPFGNEDPARADTVEIRVG